MFRPKSKAEQKPNFLIKEINLTLTASFKEGQYKRIPEGFFYREKMTEKESKKGRGTDRQTDRQTEREREREKEREREMWRAQMGLNIYKYVKIRKKT